MSNNTSSANVTASTSSNSLDILELEKLCEQLYNANSPQQIHEANKVLEEFASSSDCLNKCQILLDRGVVSEN
jgi:exportin-7